MQVYPEDVLASVQQSKKIAEDSKKCVQPPRPNPSQVDAQWESVKNRRQQ